MVFFLSTSPCPVLGHSPGPKTCPCLGPRPGPEPNLVSVLGPGPSPIIFMVPALVPVPSHSEFHTISLEPRNIMQCQLKDKRCLIRAQLFVEDYRSGKNTFLRNLFGMNVLEDSTRICIAILK